MAMIESQIPVIAGRGGVPMKVEPVAVEAMTITEVAGLDRIYVYWVDVGPGQGYATITCWGSAWTVFFGGMGNQAIRQFFAEADTPYLVSKMGITQHLKQSRRAHAYLGKLVDAVKGALNRDAQPV